MNRRSGFVALAIVAAQTIAAMVLADEPDAGADLDLDAGAIAVAPAIADAGSDAADAAPPVASCVERVPEGATRPQIIESMPNRGTSGYEVRLKVIVEHGKGETVLPNGFEVQRGDAAHDALVAAGFVVPEVDGGSPPTIAIEAGENGARTTITIALVALPKKAGRHELVLPPLPIAVARASGELMTVCTSEHAITVEDPVVNEAAPEVKPNPPPRAQREEWVVARKIVEGLLIGLPIGALLLGLALWWRRRPKYVPPPPPIPPWITALEELDAVRKSKLLAEGKQGEYFDGVSDAVRKYLGARYGYDGLESTTDEARASLDRVRPRVVEMERIKSFLERCDLVKFANVTPDDEDCVWAMDTGEQIVRRTIPDDPVIASAELARGSR